MNGDKGEAVIFSGKKQHGLNTVNSENNSNHEYGAENENRP